MQVYEWPIIIEYDVEEDVFLADCRRYGETVRTVLAIANKPSRKLPRKALQEAIEDGGCKRLSIDESLRQLALPATTPLNRSQCTNLSGLLDLVRPVHRSAD